MAEQRTIRTIQATVILNDHGLVTIRVRRNYINEMLNGAHPDLKPGERIRVFRKVNDPYLHLYK